MRQGHCYLWNTIFLIPREKAWSLQKAGWCHTFCVLLSCVKTKSLWLLELRYPDFIMVNHLMKLNSRVALWTTFRTWKMF